MQIELDIFSGRPNPKWTCDEAQALRLGELLTGLPEVSAAEASPEPPGLGYRGFYLVQDSTTGHAIRTTIYAGSVQVSTRDGKVRRFLDADRAVERFLAEEIHSHLEPAVWKILVDAIG